MNKILVNEKEVCRLCASKNLTNALNLKSTPIGDDYQKHINKNLDFYKLILNKCDKCGFVQLSNVIDPNSVYGDYIYVTTTSSGLPQHFKNLVDKLFKDKIVNEKSKILELGSNDGTLLDYFMSKGCKVIGVDPAKEMINNLNKNFETITEMFNFELAKEILSKNGQFDLIIANNVIANIDDLNDTFKGIDLLLKDNGSFVMETFSLYGVLTKNLIDNIYHEHLSYFTIKNFEKFLLKFNLQLVEADHLDVKGGSIRFIFKKTKEKIVKKLRTSNCIEYEENANLDSFNSFKKIEEINFKNNSKLNQFIEEERKRKKIFAGYGASVGTTTFMYYYNLIEYVEYLFDDEQKRHNLFSPGSNIEVISPKKILELMPDYIIIFAWRYSDLILKKNSEYILKGGQFIIPLPEFKIIKA